MLDFAIADVPAEVKEMCEQITSVLPGYTGCGVVEIPEEEGQDTVFTFPMWTNYKTIVVSDGNGRYGYWQYDRRKYFDLHKGAALALIDLFVANRKANDARVSLIKFISENHWEVQADMIFLGQLAGVVGYDAAQNMQSGEYADPLRQAMLDNCDFPLAIVTHNMD